MFLYWLMVWTLLAINLIGTIPLCYINIVVYYSVYKHNIYHKNDKVYLINYTAV